MSKPCRGTATRALFLFVVLVALLLGSFGSMAATASNIATVGSRYVPGDDSTKPITLVIVQGSDVTYTNLDPVAAHSVTADQVDPLTNLPLFDSSPLSFRGSALVRGTAALSPGTYGFHCAVHQIMHGSLTVVAT